MIRVRHIEILTEDKEHMICCLEDVEHEVRREEEHAKDLQSARKMARRDELTGVRNKHAYQEYIDSIEKNIKGGFEDFAFGVVVCDLNDLKLLNDTRGHSFGDEAIQSSSRMICETFSHSPIFRIGGDEFVAILSGRDYDERRRKLDSMFGALFTIAGDGYVYLCDMKHDFSRWALSLVNDFDMPSEYMYRAGQIWEERVHPEDLGAYNNAIKAVFSEDDSPKVTNISYRVKNPEGTYTVCKTRGFVLSDATGEPEYFGGIIITQ